VSVLVLTGDRVVLRPVNPDDVEPLWLAKQDPLTWARTTAAPLVPSSLESVRARYADRGGSKSDAAFSVDVDGELAGQASLFGVDDLARTAEVGLWLLPEMRGRGLGQDVLRVLVDYGFRSRNLRRVHLQTLARNTPALRCYTAVGFAEEGRLREHAWVEGAYDDIVLMGLLRADRARQR
jgi:RimJ/RimL family protein N-acetyltransferase